MTDVTRILSAIVSGFVNHAKGNYQFSSGSPHKGLADGADLGATIQKVNAKMAGVR